MYLRKIDNLIQNEEQTRIEKEKVIKDLKKKWKGKDLGRKEG